MGSLMITEQVKWGACMRVQRKDRVELCLGENKIKLLPFLADEKYCFLESTAPILKDLSLKP